MTRIIYFTSLTLILSVSYIFYTLIEEEEKLDRKQNVRPEYILELVGQDSVYVKTPYTVYKIRFEELSETIELDNL